MYKRQSRELDKPCEIVKASLVRMTKVREKERALRVKGIVKASQHKSQDECIQVLLAKHESKKYVIVSQVLEMDEL